MITCWVPKCGRRARSCGLCDSHYRQWKRGEPVKPLKARARRDQGERLEEAAEALRAAVTADDVVRAKQRLREAARSFADNDTGNTEAAA